MFATKRSDISQANVVPTVFRKQYSALVLCNNLPENFTRNSLHRFDRKDRKHSAFCMFFARTCSRFLHILNIYKCSRSNYKLQIKKHSKRLICQLSRSSVNFTISLCRFYLLQFFVKYMGCLVRR